MLDYYGMKFCCDECPICDGVESRLRNAIEGGYAPQLDHCGCEKVQYEFFIGGYCSDAFDTSDSQSKRQSPKKSGRAYRRAMRRYKKEKLMRAMVYTRRPNAGRTEWDWKDGVFQPVGNYIQHPRSSHTQTFWKTYSNRKVRRYKDSISKGNSYRRYFDYDWELD